MLDAIFLSGPINAGKSTVTSTPRRCASMMAAMIRGSVKLDLNGPFGSPVLACAGKTDPPSLLVLSQTSASNGVQLRQRVFDNQAGWTVA
jgi:hypothetical protein